MKEKTNIKTKIAVVGIIALTLLIIGIISVPNVLQKMGVQVGEKEGEDAENVQVLVGKTFTSSLAGVGAAGAMADYTQNLQTAQIAANETGVSIVNIPAGYYEQIQVDATAVYQAGLSAGVTTHTKTYTPTTRSSALDLGVNHIYRYVNTNSVPNSNSDTYTLKSSETGTKDLGATNTYRYVDASNVYTKGKADGSSLSYELLASKEIGAFASAGRTCSVTLSKAYKLVIVAVSTGASTSTSEISISGVTSAGHVVSTHPVSDDVYAHVLVGYKIGAAKGNVVSGWAAVNGCCTIIGFT